jgi:CheY-like chemotaxis protein
MVTRNRSLESVHFESVHQMNCGVKTVLVLEDEPLVMKLLLHILKQFNVIAATTGEEALQAFGNLDRPVDLLITDVRLPQLSGIQVALRIRSQRPESPVVVMSGYLANGWRDVDTFDLERLGSQSVVLLPKPFQARALLKAVFGLLGTSVTEISTTA